MKPSLSQRIDAARKAMHELAEKDVKQAGEEAERASAHQEDLMHRAEPIAQEWVSRANTLVQVLGNRIHDLSERRIEVSYAMSSKIGMAIPIRNQHDTIWILPRRDETLVVAGGGECIQAGSLQRSIAAMLDTYSSDEELVEYLDGVFVEFVIAHSIEWPQAG